MYTIVALYGKSGSGKDTFLEDLFKDKQFKKDFHKIVRTTTRPKRKEEVDGEQYYFISPEEMIEQILTGEIAEAGAFGPQNWVYATPYRGLSKDKFNIGAFDIEAVMNLMDDPEIDVLPVFIHCPDTIRLSRALLRGEDSDIDEIFRRYKAERAVYAECQYFIENETAYVVDNSSDKQNLLEEEDCFKDYLNKLLFW